ncbi:MAG: glycoside hydrolase family 3 protein [Rhodobacteraceae bacterium]|nr:glycoside hydrolase family 3 protein [Paracoccaceae bacterium]
MDRTPRALILGVPGPTLAGDTRALLARADPWGFILFARNIESPRQVAALVADLRDAVGREAPVLVDQEGGRVQRLRPPLWRGWPDVATQMAQVAPDRAARAMWLRGRLMASELRPLGIDVNCAPVADVAGPRTHPFLAPRCPGHDAATVTAMARALAEGLMAGGVLPVIKHLPGHGRAQADSHTALPRIDAPLPLLEESDFAPFRALAHLPMGMSAHVVLEALDPDCPATLSAPVIGHIRRSIGFGGLLMTDDISMGALSGPVAMRGRAALAAGCDVVLHCNGDPAETAALTEALPRLAGDAAARAMAALAARPAAPPPLAEEAALDAEWRAALGLDGDDG